MQSEKVEVTETSMTSLSANTSMNEKIGVIGNYVVECFDQDGNIKWQENIENIVVTVGKNDLLDKYFAGSAYTAAWYMGLVDGASTPTYAITDTMSSHAGWTESTGYSNSTRPTVAWNAASSGSKVSTATSFSINATVTIIGAFMVTNSTKGGTTGTLYSAGSFSAGSRSVLSGDTLNVTYTSSV
jgi:hypothetical protein